MINRFVTIKDENGDWESVSLEIMAQWIAEKLISNPSFMDEILVKVTEQVKNINKKISVKA